MRPRVDKRRVGALNEWDQSRRPIDVEKHQLRTLVGDDVVERMDDGGCADRGVDERMKCEDRGQSRSEPRLGSVRDLLLQSRGQPPCLQAGVGGK